MKTNHYLAFSVALLLLFGLSFSPVEAQENNRAANCGSNFVTITGESRAPQCSTAEVVSCKVAAFTAVTEANSFSCPSSCPIKSQVETISEDLSCSEWFDPVIGPSINKASCKITATFNCSSENNNFEDSVSSLEEDITVTDQDVEIEELEALTMEGEIKEPGLKRAMTNFGQFIGSFFGF